MTEIILLNEAGEEVGDGYSGIAALYRASLNPGAFTGVSLFQLTTYVNHHAIAKTPFGFHVYTDDTTTEVNGGEAIVTATTVHGLIVRYNALFGITTKFGDAPEQPGGDAAAPTASDGGHIGAFGGYGENI